MKSILPGITLLILLVAQPASASGIFTLKGKVRGFSDASYSISTENLTYEVAKESLSPEQLSFLKDKKSGQDIELTVTTESIVNVRQNTAKN